MTRPDPLTSIGDTDITILAITRCPSMTSWATTSDVKYYFDMTAFDIRTLKHKVDTVSVVPIIIGSFLLDDCRYGARRHFNLDVIRSQAV